MTTPPPIPPGCRVCKLAPPPNLPTLYAEAGRPSLGKVAYHAKLGSRSYVRRIVRGEHRGEVDAAKLAALIAYLERCKARRMQTVPQQGTQSLLFM